jgi:ATP-dependent Clp protease ATP-binding subunit ClpA
MQIPYDDMTNDARRAIERARQQAARRQDEQARPEHLLLAIVEEAGSVACKALAALGIVPAQIVEILARQMPPARDEAAPRPLAYDSELVVHFATKEAYQLGHR